MVSESKDELIARCPICGDSKRHANVARLHLYGKFNLPLVNCFNGGCPVQNMPLGNFLRIFYPTVFQRYKRESLNNLSSLLKPDANDSGAKLENVGSDWLEDSLNPRMANESTPAPASSTPTISTIQTIQTIKHPIKGIPTPWEFTKENPKIREYLVTRGLEAFANDFWYSLSVFKAADTGKTYNTTNSIVLPLTYENKWYGFYSRSIETKRFATYMAQGNDGFKVWNLFHVDLSKKIYIFEGVFDALAAKADGLTNVVACLGATISDKALALIPQPVFCYDNDITGWKNTHAQLKANPNSECLVIPERYTFKDANEARQQGYNLKDLISNFTYTGLKARILLEQKL